MKPRTRLIAVSYLLGVVSASYVWLMYALFASLFDRVDNIIKFLSAMSHG